MKPNVRCWVSAAALLSSVYPTVALAQEAAAPAVDQGAAETGELVVTAQRRTENVQDVPISIAAFSAADLEAANVATIFDLPRLTPGLTIDTGNTSGKARITIRGVGSAGGTAVEPSVATYLDGFYIPREGATIWAYLDLEGLEVLRGPQGTIFGRNASVGAINLRSALPRDELSGNLTGEVGSGGRYMLDGYVNLPVNDQVAFRIAARAETMDGLYENQFNGDDIGGYDSISTRVTSRIDFTPDFQLILRANYSDLDHDGFTLYQLLPDTFPPGGLAAYEARCAGVGAICVDNDPFDTKVNRNPEGYGGLTDVQWGGSATAILDTPSGFSFRFLANYQDWDNNQEKGDALTSTVPTFTQFIGWASQSSNFELQVFSPTDTLLGGRLDFVAGLYYFTEDFQAYEAMQYKLAMCEIALISLSPAIYNSCVANSNAQAFNADFEQSVDSYAAYGQATFALASSLDLVLGARWTRDEKSAHFWQAPNFLAGTLNAATEDTLLGFDGDRFTYRAGLNWRPTEDLLVFGSYSTGYKSGGFNSQSAARNIGQGRIVDPETVENIELGFRSDWFERLLRVNLTLYHMEISDFQDRSYDGVSYSLQNAGDIRSQGAEFEVSLRPNSDLRLYVSGAYLDSEFTDYTGASNLPGLPGTVDITGTRPQFATEWTGSVGLEYESEIEGTDLSFAFRSDLAFSSDSPRGVVNDANPQVVHEPYELLNARATLYGPGGRWSISAFGNNLTQTDYCTSYSYMPFGGLVGGVGGGRSALTCNTVGTPRTLGIAASFEF